MNWMEVYALDETENYEIRFINLANVKDIRPDFASPTDQSEVVYMDNTYTKVAGYYLTFRERLGTLRDGESIYGDYDIEEGFEDN